MTQRIYIVTSGEYSDYRIEAAYTDYEQALAAAKRASRPDSDGYRPSHLSIEVYEGDKRIWDAEEEIKRDTYTLYTAICNLTTQPPVRYGQEEIVFNPQRATLERDHFTMRVTGTDLAEVKKVLSDAIAADYQAKAQRLIDGI